MKERVRIGHGDPGVAIFALLARFDGAAQCFSHRLHAIADAKDGNPQIEQLRIAGGGLRRKHALGAPGKNDAGWPALLQLGGGRVMPDNLGIDMLFAHTPGDELRVLRTEIENGDVLIFFHLVGK